MADNPPVGPEVEPGDVDVDVKEFCIPRPMSWDRRKLNAEVAERGWKNKFNITMAVQVGLSTMYAIVYGLSFAGLNAYYEWPLEMTTDEEVALEAVLTDEDYFMCDGTTFYLNGTGPIGSENVVYDNSTYEVLRNMGIYWGLSIGFFVLFIIAKLYLGQYNQLLLLVKFEKDDDDEVKPVKLSFAYTIMCNAKSFSNVVFTDLCKICNLGFKANHKLNSRPASSST